MPEARIVPGAGDPGDAPVTRRDLRTPACLAGLVAIWAFAWWPVIALGRMLSTGASRSIGLNAVDPGRLTTGVPTYPPEDWFRPDAGASAWQLEPWFHIAAQQWTAGIVPLWTPFQGFGAPLAANFQSAVFDPLLMLPIIALGVPGGQDVAVLGLLLAGMLAAFGFARVAGLTRLAGLVAGTGFGLSGFFLTYSNNEFCRLYAYIPILLLLVELLLRRRQARWFALIAVVVALAIVGGMPEITFMVLLFAVVYAVWRVIVGPRVWSRKAALLQLAAAAFAGVLLAAPLLLPAAEYVGMSFNTHSGGGAAAETLPRWMAWYLPVPFWAGLPSASPGGVRGWTGAAIGALAVVGLFAPTRGRRLIAVPAVIVIAIVAGRAYGFLPLEWISSLPGLKAIIFDRWGYVPIGFAMTLLAAVGVDAIARGALTRRRACALAVALIAIAVISGREILGLSHDLAVPLARPGFVLAMVVVVGVAIAGVLPRTRIDGRAVQIGALLVTALVVGELCLFAHKAWPIYSVRTDALAAPAWMPTLESTVAADPESRVLGFDGRLTPDTAGVYGLQDIRTIDALYPKRYFDYVQAFLEPTAVDRFDAWPSFDSRAAVRNPMFQLTGTRWLVSSAGTPTPASLSRVPAETPRIADDGAVAVYESRLALPRVFVASMPITVSGADASRDEIARRLAEPESFDARRDVVVEADASAVPKPCPSGGRARIAAYEPNRVVVEAEAHCPAILVLTDLAYPGWSASVGGRPADILLADVAFRGVVIPAGRSRVAFDYVPGSFHNGLVLACAGVVLLVLGTLAIRRAAPSGR